jgi:hypothetical protein
VLIAPERAAASTTTTPVASAAMIRFRVKKRSRCGAHPGGFSEMTRPAVAIRS